MPFIRERSRFGNMLPTMEQIKESRRGEDEVFIAASNCKYPSIFSHNSIPSDVSISTTLDSQPDKEAKRYESPLRRDRNVVTDLKARIERTKRKLL